MARAAAAKYGYPAGFLARYFEKLRYRFGARERIALASFFRAAAAAGSIERAPELVFAGSGASPDLRPRRLVAAP